MATETSSSAAAPGSAPPRAPGRRRLVFHLTALAVSALLFVLGLELVLRLGAGVIAPALGELGNAVYSRYGSLPGDIYVFDHELSMTFMRPDFETTNYWNGYFWHHATDSRGFRNPPGLEDTSLLVLGDSFIYGHGVEEEHTLTAYLRSEHGRPAYNMGRQGDCLFQHYVLLRLFLDRLQPRRVVLFVFVNDFHDLTVFRTPEQIRERPEIDRYDYDRIYARVQRKGTCTVCGPSGSSTPSAAGRVCSKCCCPPPWPKRRPIPPRRTSSRTPTPIWRRCWTGSASHRCSTTTGTCSPIWPAAAGSGTSSCRWS